MIGSEFRGWLTQAEQDGASILEVRRARKNGNTKLNDLFLKTDIKTVNAERLLERMREDILSRRLVTGAYELLAKSDNEDISKERIIISRDDTEDPSIDLDSGVALARINAQQTERAYSEMAKMANATCQELRAVIGDLAGRLVDQEGKVAEMLTSAFDLAMLKSEREKEQLASEERRAIAKDALSELGPIAGSILASVTRNATPAWAAFAKSLGETPGQLEKVASLLTKQQLASLESALGLTFPKDWKGGDANG